MPGYASANDALATLSDPAAKANYCLYTRSMELSGAAAGKRDPLKLIPMVQTLQTWEATVATLLPQKDMRRAEMTSTLTLFNQQVTQRTDAGEGAEAAKQAVISDSASACSQLLAELQSSELKPRQDKPAVVAKQPVAAALPPPVQPTEIQRDPDSPFHKDVFAPGWRGDLVWSGSTTKERAVLMSFDGFPPGKDSKAIHANLRISGANARAHCVDHIVESGSSPDGMTLYARPIAGNTCGAPDRVISLYAVAEDRMRMEISEGRTVVAAGDFAPTTHDARFTFAQPPVPAPTPAPAPGPTAQPAGDMVALAQASATPPADNTAPEDCLTCIPTQPGKVGPDDLLTRLLSQPLKGRFDWNWQETRTLFDRSQGTLVRTAQAPDGRQTFQLTFDSESSLVCTGVLREVGRSGEGYLIHLKVAPPANGQRCQPQVTHGYIVPFTPSDTTKANFLWIKLYSANDKQVTESILRNDMFQPPVALQANKAKLAWDTLRGMEKAAEDGRKNHKLVAFKQSPEFQRLAPLYNGCLKAAPDIFGISSPTAYCQCISQKFGIGGRLSDAEFAAYSADIRPLIKLITGPHTAQNKLHVRLGETCRQCSFPDNELETWCNERDSLLYVASNYADMIRLLDTATPTVEATSYYKKVFYRTYLQGFSTLCPDHIVDPVPFEYIVFETTYGGGMPPETRITQRDKTYVARRYAGKYKQFGEDINTPASVGQISGAINSAGQANAASLRRAIRDGQTMIKTEVENRQAISQHMAKGCSSESVQRVYGNLLQLVD